MATVMQGVRIVEVAEYAFVPAATGLLSDWGAEVIKVEPVERGDAARALGSAGGVHVLYEHSNRGKRSIALDISAPEGLEILYNLVRSADVFATNKLPSSRKRLKIDVDHIRAHNPSIVYVRGSGQGQRGPEAHRGSYDLLAFWHRSGVSSGVMRDDGTVPYLPGPGFGDSLSALAMAGGIMGALFHRERTGEAPVVDVSLLATGMWGMAVGIGLAQQVENYPWPPAAANPLSQTYRTKDGRWIAISCLQAGKYWVPLCKCLGQTALSADVRFGTHDSILRHRDDASRKLQDVFARRTLGEWIEVLADFEGQWTVVQDMTAVAHDAQVQANGYLQAHRTAQGGTVTLVTAPVQYDEAPAHSGRAPDHNEHGDTLLSELGFTWDDVVDLKLRGIVG